MKRNAICLLLLVLVASLFAENVVTYKRSWNSRNTLLYEEGNMLWDIYVNKISLTNGTIYNIQFCIESREKTESTSTFEGWFIQNEYNLYFDSYKKRMDFMNALTQEYLKDKSILKTDRFMDFTENRMNYKFTNNSFYDYEVKRKKYLIKLISNESYSASIYVYKNLYGACEDTEYSFLYSDDESNTDYWIDDFEAGDFFLQFANFYENESDSDEEKNCSLQDYFATLSGKRVEAAGTSSTFTVSDYSLETLFLAFKHDLIYTAFSVFCEVLRAEDENE